MSIGMSYTQFWEEDVSMASAYLKADELRQRRVNREMWMNGYYTYEALLRASTMLNPAFAPKDGNVKAEPYLEKPVPVTALEVRAEREAQAKARQERIRAAIEAVQARRRRSKKGADNG